MGYHIWLGFPNFLLCYGKHFSQICCDIVCIASLYWKVCFIIVSVSKTGIFALTAPRAWPWPVHPNDLLFQKKNKSEVPTKPPVWAENNLSKWCHTNLNICSSMETAIMIYWIILKKSWQSYLHFFVSMSSLMMLCVHDDSR